MRFEDMFVQMALLVPAIIAIVGVVVGLIEGKLGAKPDSLTIIGVVAAVSVVVGLGYYYFPVMPEALQLVVVSVAVGLTGSGILKIGTQIKSTPVKGEYLAVLEGYHEAGDDTPVT